MKESCPFTNFNDFIIIFSTLNLFCGMSRSATVGVHLTITKSFSLTFSLYKLYPARVPARNTTKYQDLIRIQPQLQPGQGRSSYVQGAYQLGAILVTVVLALVGGVLTGNGNSRFKCLKKHFKESISKTKQKMF